MQDRSERRLDEVRARREIVRAAVEAKEMLAALDYAALPSDDVSRATSAYERLAAALEGPGGQTVVRKAQKAEKRAERRRRKKG